MNEILSSEVFLLTLTLGTYLIAVWLYRKTGFKLLHPMLLSMAVIISFLKLTDIDYETYRDGTAVIELMLGLSVVCLGLLLYEQIDIIKGNLLTISVSVFTVCIIGIGSVVLIAKYMGATEDIITSIQPKSVTTPIALSISKNSVGIESLTALVVVYTGIFGSIAGPVILRTIRVKNRIAKGLAMGSAAHAVGTAEAVKMGATEGAVSGLAIGIMGIFTAILIPVLQTIF
ncbi:MAG: LrgB family protein [Rikenellaceae bacterium]|nr:LrgB family protein [Rikenellaceae bacterium]